MLVCSGGIGVWQKGMQCGRRVVSCWEAVALLHACVQEGGEYVCVCVWQKGVGNLEAKCSAR